ncbi:MAG: radical SAM protein, partial [Candidatus Omnitrophica bacterium]|nr:radical SAM protein [Candidatus Omnitrophota bacterium]
HEDVIRLMKKARPDCVAVTAVTPSIISAAKMAKMIKCNFPGLPVIIGGAHFTALPEKTLSEYADFDAGVVGEGEQTIVELVCALSSGGDLSDLAGIAFRGEGETVLTKPREFIKNLDELPFPAWETLSGFPHKYRPAIFKYKRLPSAQIVTSRGCPHECIFCDTSVFGRNVRFHSAGYVLDEIEYLVKKFGIRDIIFEDDQFLLKKGRLEDICSGLLKRKTRISWSCNGRVNSVDNIDLLHLMKLSGCWQINYGIESGNQEILDAAKKSITLEKVRDAVRLTHKAGISSKGFFMLGLINETEKTIKDSINFAKNIPLDDVSVFMLTPFPGSSLYRTASRFGKFDNNFAEMNVLTAVFIPNGLSKELLENYQRRFFTEFYMRPRILSVYLKRIVSNPALCFRYINGIKALLDYSGKRSAR